MKSSTLSVALVEFIGGHLVQKLKMKNIGCAVLTISSMSIETAADEFSAARFT
ncbi:MAG: hypothetical protein H6669_06890 [Ardenticatenaceae bacterium]|nr:hypothetical protein [Ardenticatenaceae bacterium]